MKGKTAIPKIKQHMMPPPKLPTPSQSHPNQDSPSTTGGSSMSMFQYMNEHIMYLNNSKFFAGIIMLMLNIGSKFVTIQFSKNIEEYLKLSIMKQILVFSVAWMGTKDIYVSLFLTAAFTVLSEHLFNEESSLCVLPEKSRAMNKIMTNINDGTVTPEQLKQAEAILQKAKQDSMKRAQREAFTNFDLHKI
jgi:hypothetical protein